MLLVRETSPKWAYLIGNAAGSRALSFTLQNNKMLNFKKGS